jgi:hypothetical protein
MIAIAMRYPPDVALDLARYLSGESISSTDVRVAQFRLGNVLDRAGDGSLSAERIGGGLLSRRTKRISAAAKAYRDRLESQADAAIDQTRRATMELEKERFARKALETTLIERDSEASRLRQQLSEERRLGMRKMVAAAVTTAAFLIGVGTLIIGHPWIGTAMLLSAAIFYGVSREWVSDLRVGVARLFASMAPQVLSIIEIGQRLG